MSQHMPQHGGVTLQWCHATVVRMSTHTDSRTNGRLVLLRHGQTAWSVSGQHTGRTDLPLTKQGEHQAVVAGEELSRAFPDGFTAEHVYVSPLLRAQQTARLAGFAEFQTLPGIAEWDYGRAEGRTLAQISAAVGRPWDLWNESIAALPESLGGDHVETLAGGQQVSVHNGDGETLDQVAKRASGVVEELAPIVAGGYDVLLVAHAHILRILTTQWLGVSPQFAKLLRMGTAHYSVLSIYRGDRVIDHWNI